MIRPAAEADAEAIEAVIRRAWQREGLDEPEARVERWRERTRAPHLTVLVWDQDGRVAGVVSVGSSDDEDVPVGRAMLRALYVDPPAQGAGVGSALFTAAVDHLRGAGYREVDLWVFADNDHARAFYERRGFSPAGEGIDPATGLTELRYRRPL